MANQLQITGDTKVKSLNGVLTGTSGIVGSVPLGAANGVATLDSGGKVPVSQLPSSVVTYLGTWNAATNTPTLTNGVGDAGDMYLCNVAGTVNFGAGPVTFAVGDWVLYGSGTWQKSNGQNGTVTSVGATITGGAIGITGSPITTAGTLAFAFTGTSGQYVNGAGNLTTFPSLTGYVPYTGATNDLNLGTHNLYVNNIFDGFINVAASGSQIVLTIASVPSYTITGSGGQTIKLPDATTLPNGAIFSFNNNQSSGAITINNNSNTLIVSVPSGGFAEVVLLDNSIAAGSWDRHFKAPSNVSWSTNTLDYAGSITSATWNGNVVAINRGGTGSSTQNFVDLTTTQTIGGAKTFSSSLTASSLIKTGGTSSQFLKADGSVDSSSYIILASLSATSPLSYNNTTGAFSIQVANTSQSGYLSSTDWNTFNSKQSTLTFTSPLVNTSGTVTIPAATSSVNGYLTSTDWATFNGKQAALSGTGIVKSTAGTISYLTDNSTNWNTAYNRSLTSAAVTGTTTKTLTLNQQDGGTITAYWTDINTDAVTSVFGRTGAIIAVSGDYNTDLVTEGTTNLYFTNSRARLALSAGTGISYNNTTGVITSTITQYTDALARAAISLTTTGTSGAATYNSTTGVLNIPQYTDAYTGTVTSVALSAPTGFSVTGSPVTSSGTLALAFSTGYSLPTTASQSNWDTAYTYRVTSVASPLTFDTGTHIIAIGVASSSSNGYLNAADWTTFNNKQSALTNPVTGTGTTNYLPKFTGASTIGNSLVYDNGTNVGIGTASPTALLHLSGANTAYRGQLTIQSTDYAQITFYKGATTNTDLNASIFSNISTSEFVIRNNANAATIFDTNATERMRIWGSTGNVNIGTTPASDSGYKLDVNGTGRFSGDVTYDASSRNANVVMKATSSYASGLYYLYNGNYQWNILADSSNNLNFLKLAGGTATVISFTQAGAATFSSSVTAGGNIILTPSDSRIYAGDNSGRGIFSNANVTSYITMWGSASSYPYNIEIIAGSGTSSGNITFNTGNTDRMRITNTGNVGIGTTGTPQDKLEVVGAGFFNNGSNAGARIGGAATYGFLTAYTYNFGASAPLVLQTNGANVLIGTTTDAGYKLDVNGTGRFSANVTIGSSSSTPATSEAALFFGSSNYLNIGAIGTDVFFNNNAYYNGSIWKYINTNPASDYYQSNGTHVFRYAASGTAGGTITWSTALSLANTGAATFSSNITGNANIITSTGLRVRKNTTSDGANDLGIFYSNSGDVFNFYDWNTATKGMSLNTGTGAATFSSSVGTTAINMNNMSALGSIGGGYIFMPYTAGVAFRSADGSVGYGTIKANASGAILLNSSGEGNVGIGTTSPSRLLSIEASVSGNSLFSIKNTSSTGYGSLVFFNDGASYFSSGLGGSSASAFTGAAYLTTGTSTPIIFATNNDVERMRITSGGVVSCLSRVLVNGATDDSTNALQVNGSIVATSTIAAVVPSNVDMFVFNNTGATYTKSCVVASMTATGGTGSYFFYGQQSTSTVALKIFSNGNIQNTNNSYGAISDARLKENITDATPKLEDLLKVKVRNYNLKGEKTKQLGVISQELEEIFPNMIEESTNLGENVKIKGVKYSVFVPMLIKAVQEQQEQINELKQLLNK
jgi:Chaperone of endosialidase